MVTFASGTLLKVEGFGTEGALTGTMGELVERLQQEFWAGPAAVNVALFAAPLRDRCNSGEGLQLRRGLETLAVAAKGHQYPRAGDATGGVMVLPGMDSIDASLFDTSFDNHFYFAAERSVVSDIELMLRNGLPPVDRSLKEVVTGNSKHWVFRP